MKKESFIVSCIRRLREYGEGILLADQAISSLLEVVKANVYTILCLSQTSQKDRREVISALGLNAQQGEITNFLETGQGIVRLAGRYPFPQLLNFPFVAPKNISEKELDQMNCDDVRIRDLLGKVIPVTQNEDPEAESQENTSQDTPGKPSNAKKSNESEKAKDMLIDIANRFDIPSSQRAKDLSLSGSAADRIFKYIEKKQYVDVIKLNLSGARGGVSKYYSLSKSGYQTIDRTPPKQSGGTGATHFFLERYLKKHLPSKGFSDLIIEKNINGKRIDLFGQLQELRVAIEICCSTMRTEFLNVQKDMDKCDVLVIVTPDKKTKEKLNKELFKIVEAYKKLKTCVVYELLNDPEKIIKQT